MPRTTLWLATLLCTACGSGTPAAKPVTEGRAATPDSHLRVIPITSASPEAIALFQKGVEEQDSAHWTEAGADFRKALALDPSFLLAEGHLGEVTPGPKGLALTRSAAAASAGLPDAERLDLQAMLAIAEGDEAKAYALCARVAALAPDDWRAQSSYGEYATYHHDLPVAIGALTRASELAPKAGPVWNLLAYARSQAGDHDGALAAVDQYVAVEPNQSNAWDSKGEMLLLAGRLPEAEAAFDRAGQLDPGFWPAFDGVAQVHFLEGDARGGFAALDQAEHAASVPGDTFRVRLHRAWARFALGDPAAAGAVLDGLDTYTADHALTVQHANVPVNRAEMALLSDRPADVLVALREATTRGARLEGNDADMLKLRTESMALIAEAESGQVTRAEARLPVIDRLTAKHPSDPDEGQIARGVLALARKDAPGAVAALSHCDRNDALCGMYLARARDQSGDSAGATATRERVRTLNNRFGEFLGIWSKVGGPAHLQGGGGRKTAAHSQGPARGGSAR